MHPSSCPSSSCSASIQNHSYAFLCHAANPHTLFCVLDGRCCETLKPSRLWNIRLTLRQGASRRNRRPRLRPNTGTSAFPQFLAQPLFLSRGSPPPPTLPGTPKDGLSKMRPRRVRLPLLLPTRDGWLRIPAYSPASPPPSPSPLYSAVFFQDQSKRKQTRMILFYVCTKCDHAFTDPSLDLEQQPEM